MAYMDTGFKISCPSVKEWPFIWIDALQKLVFLNGWRSEKLHWSRKFPHQMNPPQKLDNHIVSTYDGDKPNRTNQGGNLWLIN